MYPVSPLVLGTIGFNSTVMVIPITVGLSPGGIALLKNIKNKINTANA
jgi:hypothetical protein